MSDAPPSSAALSLPLLSDEFESRRGRRDGRAPSTSSSSSLVALDEPRRPRFTEGAAGCAAATAERSTLYFDGRAARVIGVAAEEDEDELVARIVLEDDERRAAPVAPVAPVVTADLGMSVIEFLNPS